MPANCFNSIRITVGTLAQNRTVLKVLKEIL
jgi:histidinol-phosphate/aromatic aminotransferase/cobyric acid decarboxylase-like protein